MHEARIGIFGGSGYAGLELTRILMGHPHARLALVASERWAGSSVAGELGLPDTSGLRFSDFKSAEAQAEGLSAVLLATPAEVSLELAPRLLAKGCKVIDLSGAFRLGDAAVFTKYYGLAAPDAGIQRETAYGMPELFRAAIPGARLVSNPGCYATAAALALAPLLKAGLVDPSSLIVDAASGVTGAGRKASEDYAFTELSGEFKAYKILKHQHTPEIAQTLSRVGGAPLRLTFTPHLLPVARGILCTCYARLAQPATAGDLTAAMQAFYRDEPFVTLAAQAEQVTLRRVVGTNQCLIGVACEPEVGGQVVVLSAIDNLVKGAAGQAVQNLNLMHGWPETAGLATLRRFTP